MYTANMADAGQWQAGTVRLFLYSLSAFIFLVAPFSLQALMVTTQPRNQDLRELIDPLHAMILAVFALTSASFSYNLIRSDEAREWLSGRLPGYKPESLVHLSAILLTLLVLTFSGFQFMLTGGLAGVAESLESTEISPSASLFETALWLVAAVLGVGYAIRRTMPQTLERLGLRLPTAADGWIGVGVGFGLFVASVLFSIVWQLLADPATFAEQIRAAEGFSSQLRSLPLILLVAGGAAFGEEIFMRGALQPVLGLWATSAFFALLHSQYLLTPLFIFILFVGLTFGLLRRRVSTTAAIIAHLVYNLAPFLIPVLTGGSL